MKSFTKGYKESYDKSQSKGMGIWAWLSLMYLFTSDTVQPIDKMEYLWRMMAGPFNFLPGL